MMDEGAGRGKTSYSNGRVACNRGREEDAMNSGSSVVISVGFPLIGTRRRNGESGCRTTVGLRDELTKFTRV